MALTEKQAASIKAGDWVKYGVVWPAVPIYRRTPKYVVVGAGECKTTGIFKGWYIPIDDPSLRMATKAEIRAAKSEI